MVVHPFVLVYKGFFLEKLVLNALGAVCHHITRKCTATQSLGWWRGALAGRLWAG